MRFSIYTLPIEVDNGYIVFNSYRRAFATVFKEPDLTEFKQLLEEKHIEKQTKMVEGLYNMGYIVEDDKDEYGEARKYVQDCYNLSARNLTIFLYVTEKCNFRCVYCPQTHEPKVFPKEKWNALFKYIKTSLKNNLYDKISIHFFGGEPLLELKNMSEFLDKMEALKANHPNVTFQYAITTNAYLLTEKVYDKLVNYGFYYIQVTVDGFAETHDKTRVLADGRPTWQTIINNLKYINTKNDNVTIALRTNYNKDNIETLDDYCAWIEKNFDNKKFKFNLYPVSKFSEEVREEYISGDFDNEVAALRKKYDRTEDVSAKMLLPFSYACKCANISFYTISVSGLISKCEQTYNGDYRDFGYLSDDGEFVIDGDEMKKWTENFETEDCKTCLIYPLCAARCCPHKKVYYEDRPDCKAKREDVTINIKKGILKLYEKQRKDINQK